MDSGTSDSGSPDSGTADAGKIAFTVANYKKWCSVSIAGGAFVANPANQTVMVDPGTVDLAAKPANGTFKLGLWHETNGDTGAGDPGTIDAGISYTTATASSTATCVWICCPFLNDSGCNITDGGCP